MLHLLLAALLFTDSLNDVDSGPIEEPRRGVKNDLFNRGLNYMKSNPETLEELLSSDHALLEGDMMLSTDRNAVESTWPTVEIPCVISSELAHRTKDIISAMKMVSQHTCVSFHARTSETNYLYFMDGKGCGSHVGFIGGKQPIVVGPTCIVGNIAHEILHALGFYHEHTRMDREDFIAILPQNIMEGMERNFVKHKGETFNLPYDVSSIMHYGRFFFSMNGNPTIVSKSDTESMGQRVKMTKTDIEKVRLLYACDLREAPVQQTVVGFV